MFEKQKDLDIYNKFLPKVRRFMFPTFDFSENKRKKFKELDVGLQSTILQKYPCTIFEYNLGKNAQGKAGRNASKAAKISLVSAALRCAFKDIYPQRTVVYRISLQPALHADCADPTGR